MTSLSSIDRKSFRLNLTKIEGDGDFLCPKCGTMISPDDENEKTYLILSIVDNDDDLESMTIQCNICNSIITLDGFAELSEGR